MTSYDSSSCSSCLHFILFSSPISHSEEAPPTTTHTVSDLWKTAGRWAPF
ncbi:hypothetical protein PHYBLDRAFT_149117 [Phycomyces blakesleeanus NRRL 1555(-)]|uniref:Uncharacterized protein n=1 Tax=Phycomyces blakesleeanus (strain ATCC 8743b / DSM 1359 / FGSC 10004 / NBRC 33097 / NRRL 1555) TaxID=763407 RepID=A0A162ZYY5_PHYB8|nr:hypothetical protein PHYBLDRAFT_149117 [Phycomyces blakesleeanus NRRL 1555(-)]OAD69941.1 hypothetical protein PHYBLDRAFT_149117 [Phycomyces blakesleeanus NRRL 1555(-)]|eukprot:XP_018287981.1 hypothetical protein PHYBLDRAFT_149117 [Phycomyces blakesleeanus NRRL 1555(-)]